MSKSIVHIYAGRTLKDGSVPYPSNSVKYHFIRNGVSLQKLLELLYENNIDHRKLLALHNKGNRMIVRNEIIKPIFRTSDGNYIYIKCKDSKYCDVFLMTGSEFSQIMEEDLFLAKTAVIVKRDKIDNNAMRFCKRLKVEVYIKEDCTKEVRQTVENTKNVIKLKTIKNLMNRINNGEDSKERSDDIIEMHKIYNSGEIQNKLYASKAEYDVKNEKCIKKYEYNPSYFVNINNKTSIEKLLKIKENMSCSGLTCSVCPLNISNDGCAVDLGGRYAKERLDAIIEMYKTYHSGRTQNKIYALYTGMIGEFGGESFDKIVETSSYEDVCNEARNMCVKLYKAYEGRHGILSEKECEQEGVLYEDEIKSWISFLVIEVTPENVDIILEESLSKSDIELLKKYNF